MKKVFAAFFAIALIAGITPGLAGAQTGNASLQGQLDLIANLNKQIQALQQQMTDARQSRQKAVSELARTLRQGSQGDDVKALQALLAADANIYPEGLITGTFGPATARAVRRFQKKHGLSQVGHVGPMTLKKLNERLKGTPIVVNLGAEANASGTPGTNIKICAIVPPGHLIAPGWLRKQGNAPLIPSCQSLPPGIAAKLGLSATTTPDTAAPIISGIGANVGSATATITWTTNEPSDSQVMYGTSTSYGSSTASTALTTSHSVVLSNLTPGTVYHFQVKSKDAAGNMTASANQSFATTVAVSDAAAPIISGIGVTVSGSSTATVVWTTNEAATSGVFYGTTNPLDIAATSTPKTVGSGSVTSHSLNLSGLNASTTYYFVIDSSDTAGNRATSSQQTFVTL